MVPALGAAGYRAVAPDPRGYSPGVRPDPAKGLEAYAIDRLVQDVLEVLAGVGHFVTDQDAEAVTRGLLSHLARHR